MPSVGKIIRFEEARGYGFIAPADGGDDVFVHVNDFGAERHLVRPGARVEYEVEAGDRGLKVATVRILDSPPVVPPVFHRPSESRPRTTPEDDGMCDVLAPGELTAEITEVLLRHVPSLTGSQITQVRQHLVDLARTHGWLEV